MKTSKEVVQFTKNPSDKNRITNSIVQNFNILIRLLILSFILVSLVLVSFSVINNYLFDFKSQGRFNEAFVNKSLATILIQISIVAPIIEEVIFRFALKYKRNYIFRGIDFLFKTRTIHTLWTKNYRFFYYASIILFGLIHLMNYNINSYWFLILTPVIVLPQLIVGVFF